MLKNIIFIVGKNPGNLAKLKEELVNQRIQLWEVMPQEAADIRLEETIFITDMEEICRSLWERKCSVIAWLHEGNKGENLSFVPYAIENPGELDYDYFYRTYCRFHGLPWKIGETERCVIREMTPEDMDAIYEIYAAPAITLYMEGLYRERQEELEYMKKYISHAYGFWGFGTWILERRSDKKVIGRAGFNLRDGYEEPELGFVIGVPFQRQGFAYECCKRILEIGKEDYGFRKVQALVKEENLPSLELCRKLGFIIEEKVVEQGEEFLRFTAEL